jgi:ribosomal protein S18 acetylase RimI-like enzyme
MTPPWQELFQTDQERRHGFADAVAEYEGLLQSYPANGYQVELVPRLTLEERADFLEGRLGRGVSELDGRAGPIRLAAPRDHAAVADCVNAAFGGFTLRIGRPPTPMLADYGALIAEGLVRLVEVGGAVAGVLVARIRPDHLFVDVVAVRPEAQRRGVGRRLMGFAAQEAGRLGLGEVRLYTHEIMQGALALYRALDYEETGRRVEDGYARVYLRCVLPGER